MKLKYISSIAIGLGLTVSSCDVTNLSPLQDISDANFWNSTTDLELYANGLLGNLGAPSNSSDSQSDVFVTANINSLIFNTVTLSSMGDAWSVRYQTIRTCNFFMDHYQTVTGDQAEINQYVGEIRLYRAMKYYELIQLYGNVPYYDHALEMTDTEELYKTQDPRNYVLGKIIEDLQFAAQWCIDDKGVSGRPTCDVAKLFLARICLYYGTYMKYHGEQESNGYGWQNLLQLAAQYTQQIMDSGKYSIVQAPNPGLTTNLPGYPLYYSNLFEQTNVQGISEIMLARYYSLSEDVRNDLSVSEGGNGLGLTKAFADMYLMKDGTPIHNANSGYQGDNTIFDEIEGRDPRMYQTMMNKYRPRLTCNYSPSLANPEEWAYGSTVATSGAVTGYACIKYKSSDLDQNQNYNCEIDWILFRYAEVLLINAEANCELGTCTQDVLNATINQLRDRVEMAHLTTNPVVDADPLNYGYEVSPLLYEIRRERAVELISEGHRWNDLKRWNAMTLLENPLTMLGVVITPESEAFYANYNVTFGPGATEVYEYNGKTYRRVYAVETMESSGRKWTADDKRWLYPIPLAQMELNPNLVQNPGW